MLKSEGEIILFLHLAGSRRLPETWQNPYQKCDLIGKIALTPLFTRKRDKCIALVCGHQTLQGFGVVRESQEGSRKLGHFALEMAHLIDSAR